MSLLDTMAQADWPIAFGFGLAVAGQEAGEDGPAVVGHADGGRHDRSVRVAQLK